MPDALKPAAIPISPASIIATGRHLRDRLLAIADEDRSNSPRLAASIDRFVSRLHDVEAGGAAPVIGAPFPDFMLPDQNGRLVSLAALRAEGPVVVAFLRGHWCPYCQATASALGEVTGAAAAKRASIVAISPESRPFARRLAGDANNKIAVLTDIDNGYALALNLAICIDDELARLIAEDGADVPAYQSAGSWILPIPATFVVEQRGLVAARFVDADFRTRMEIEDIMTALDQLS
ncbi:MAG: peroxiredoxin-like family protein [Parvularculaceae bacterium]